MSVVCEKLPENVDDLLAQLKKIEDEVGSLGLEKKGDISEELRKRTLALVLALRETGKIDSDDVTTTVTNWRKSLQGG